MKIKNLVKNVSESSIILFLGGAMLGGSFIKYVDMTSEENRKGQEQLENIAAYMRNRDDLVALVGNGECCSKKESLEKTRKDLYPVFRQFAEGRGIEIEESGMIIDYKYK